MTGKTSPAKQPRIRWAPRVPPDLIQRLYETDAQGIIDEALIDEVGCAIYARCETIWIATERRCPHCRGKLNYSTHKGALAVCPGCQWSIPWHSYRQSYKGKRIHGGRAYPAFLEFMQAFRGAQTSRQKMIAIDRVIHAVHEAEGQIWTSPGGQNLIDGSRDEIVSFLDGLASSGASSPGVRETKRDWQRKIRDGEAATQRYYEAKNKQK